MVSENERHWDDFKQRHTASVSYAQSALRTLVLVNGGAIISLLTFIGNQKVEVGERGIFWSFVWFGAGLSAGIFAHFPAYLSQVNYMGSARFRLEGNAEAEDNTENRADLTAIISFVALFLSLLAFLAGSFVALFAIT